MQAVSAATSAGSTAGYMPIRSWLRPKPAVRLGVDDAVGAQGRRRTRPRRPRRRSRSSPTTGLRRSGSATNGVVAGFDFRPAVQQRRGVAGARRGPGQPALRQQPLDLVLRAARASRRPGCCRSGPARVLQRQPQVQRRRLPTESAPQPLQPDRSRLERPAPTRCRLARRRPSAGRSSRHRRARRRRPSPPAAEVASTSMSASDRRPRPGRPGAARRSRSRSAARRRCRRRPRRRDAGAVPGSARRDLGLGQERGTCGDRRELGRELAEAPDAGPARGRARTPPHPRTRSTPPLPSTTS